jgi:uncharacterized protein YkwD
VSRPAIASHERTARTVAGARARGARATAIASGLLMAATAIVGLGAAPAYASEAYSVVSMTNGARGSHGLSGYSMSYELNSVALGQAQRMASSGTLYHNPNLASDVSNWRAVGENVGYGPTAEKIFTAFMNSPEHRSNILDHDFTQIGVGAVRDGSGKLWVAQVFRQPMHSSGNGSSRSGSSGSSASPAASTHHTVHHIATVKARTRTVRAASSTSNAVAPRRAKPAVRKPAAKPAAAPRPSPAPTFDQRVQSLVKWNAGQPAGDPVSNTIDFAQAMATLGS